MNERERVYCRVDQWDAAGRGQGKQKIAIWELQSGKCNPKLFISYNVIVPSEKVDYDDIEEHGMDTPGTYMINRPRDEYHILSGSTSERLQYCIDHQIDIINVSLDSGAWYNEKDSSLKAEFLAQGGIIVCSAGNDGKDGLSGLSRDEATISVGAVQYSGDRIVRRHYSSYDTRGTDLDCMGFDGVIPVHRTTAVSGTSFAGPWAGSLLAYYRADFIERNGRRPTYEETLAFIKTNTEDMETEGYDVYSGNGILRLPEAVYAEPEEPAYNLVTMASGSITALVNGEPVTLAAAPLIAYDGKLMLYMKDVAKLIGGEVLSWDNATKTAVFKLPKKK